MELRDRLLLVIAMTLLALLGCGAEDRGRWNVDLRGSDAMYREAEMGPVPAAPESAPEHEQKASIRAAYLTMRMIEAANETEYAIANGPEGVRTAHAQAGHLHGTFDARGPRFKPSSDIWQARLEVAAIGCPEAMQTVEPVEPTASQIRPNRLTYARRAGKLRLSEDWTSGEPGFEQSVTIYRPPCKGREVVIEVAAEGLTPALAGDQDEAGAVELRDASGTVRLRYADLYAYDAAGAALPATMKVARERVAIRVDAGNAKWPVVIDPLVVMEEGELGANLGFGAAVALDGNTALVGAPGARGENGGKGAAYVFVRQGTAWSWQTTLYASNGEVEDFFGSSVALSGETALVGARYRDVGSNINQGAAYVFIRKGSTWAEQQELTGSLGALGDQFGSSVALSGDTALIGAPKHDAGSNPNQGSAYTFVRSGSTWTEQQELTGSLGATGDYFGSSVALSGDTALIGAPDHSSQGSAYVFVRSGTGWTEQQELTGSLGAGYDDFGDAVALSGDTALVGAPSRDVGASAGQGSAYVFIRSGTGWTEQQELTGSLGAGYDYFGSSVALSGDTVLIGASGRAVGSNAGQGSAYVFIRSGTGWTEQQELTGSLGAPSDRFGSSVALSGDVALVGAPHRDFGSNWLQGGAYAFLRSGSTWAEPQELTGSLRAANDLFGGSVALSGDTALVGASARDVGSNTDQGSAYLFGWTGSGWLEKQELTNSLGAGYDYFGSSVALSGDTVLIGASGRVVGSNAGQGSAYVFIRSGTGWTEQQELTGSLGAPSDRFGSSVALSGDVALVGAPHRDFGSNWLQGGAYAFLRSGSTWVEQQELTGSLGRTGDKFGFSVALSVDTALIGAPYRDFGSNADQGSAYVFIRSGSTWVEQQELTGSLGRTGDEFGSSVALSGDTALVGARYRNARSSIAQGSAYVFIRRGSTWSEQQELTNSAGAGGDYFGGSVALNGDTALVGAALRDVGLNASQGSAYVFVRSGSSWFEQLELTGSRGAAVDNFGWSVALSGDGVLVGAPCRDAGSNTLQGSAYVFHLRGIAGQPCKLGADCASPYFCVDDVCCTTACTQPCEVCAAMRGATKDGTCTPKPAGTPGDPECPNDVLCNGTSGACPGGCATDEHCPADRFCAWGACQMKNGEGSRCSGSNECTSFGGCVDGMCCNDPCTGACEACRADLSTGPSGVCSPATAGTPGSPACTGHVLCDGVSRACPSECTMDAHCPANQYCDRATDACRLRRARGAACAASNECDTLGGCVDGVCCNDPCTGLCQACAASTKVTGIDGECGDAKGGTDPHGQCSQDSPTTCGQTGYCNGSGACATYDSTALCGSPVCIGSNSHPRTCDGQFHCVPSNTGKGCNPFRCNPSTGECLAACLTNNDCDGSSYCSAETSQCVPKKIDGESCIAGSMCQSTYCVDGVCCDMDCAGECAACSAKKKGKGLDGDCESIAAGLDPDEECADRPATSCGNNGTCNGMGACGSWPIGTDCSINPGTNLCDGNRAVGNVCVGPGKCARDTDGLDCAPQKCLSGACAACLTDQDCFDPNATYCGQGGKCLPRKTQGSVCASNVECLSAHCVDSVCCESVCSGQCEWCGASQAPGQCSIVADGQPRGLRQPCPGTGTPCGGQCDGAQRDGCSFPGPATHCGAPASCDGDSERSAATCDSAGQCQAGSLAGCADFSCDESTHQCKNSCTSNSDCRRGAVCDTTTGTCNSQGAICKDGFQIMAEDGTVMACPGGYACVNGSCQQQCSRDQDCAPGYRCKGDVCRLVPEGAAPRQAGSSPVAVEVGGSGCSCGVAGRRHGLGVWLLLLTLGLARWSRRRPRIDSRGSFEL